jgi:hypothetical protein
MTNKETVRTFFASLWTDPELARSLATADVTWITTRSMPIPGNEGTIHHVGWDAVLNVANSGKQLDVGYGRDYENDYLFLVKLEGGKIARFQEYWDSKQAYDLIFGPW